MDGCGKSSTFRGALELLAKRICVVGIGDEVLSGGPGEPPRVRRDIPLSRSARIVGGFAKGLRWQRLYKNLKFVELTERTHIREYVARHDAPDVILTDGQPLVNCAAWSAAHFYKEDLVSDEDLLQTFGFLAGEETIPLRELPYYLSRAWPLALLNWSRVGRFRFPDLIFLLDLDPAVAMARIRARGKPLQVHETEVFLGRLGRNYTRVCRIFQEQRGVPVTTIGVDRVPLDEAVRIVADRVLTHLDLDRGRSVELRG